MLRVLRFVPEFSLSAGPSASATNSRALFTFPFRVLSSKDLAISQLFSSRVLSTASLNLEAPRPVFRFSSAFFLLPRTEGFVAVTRFLSAQFIFPPFPTLAVACVQPAPKTQKGQSLCGIALLNLFPAFAFQRLRTRRSDPKKINSASYALPVHFSL
jgi:hypothetical protein